MQLISDVEAITTDLNLYSMPVLNNLRLSFKRAFSIVCSSDDISFLMDIREDVREPLLESISDTSKIYRNLTSKG